MDSVSKKTENFISQRNMKLSKQIERNDQSHVFLHVCVSFSCVKFVVFS